MIVTEPDAILIRGVYQPEQLAEAIIDQHYAALHYLAYSILGDEGEADDAVQQTVIRAVNRIEGYRPGTNMKAWLFSILVNQARDLLRRRKARRRLADSFSRLGELFPKKSPRNTPEARAVRNEARQALWAIVNNLGEKHRIPIILRYVHDLRTAEIAGILKIREGTVHSRLHYACRKIHQQLKLSNQEQLVRELFHD